MALRSTLQKFLQDFHIEAGAPLSEADIRKAESRLGFALPESLRDCFLVADGGQATRNSMPRNSDLELPSLDRALEYRQIPGFMDSCWSYFPFALNNDSNPMCVCCRSPLAGYVVLVCHDDSPRLMFRSLESFLRAAMEYSQSGKFLQTCDLRSDFAAPDRTDNDLSIARQLMELAGTLDNEEQIDARRFACDLFADENADEIGELLNTEDEYVREHAVARLKRMAGARAKDLLHQYEAEHDSFVERCAKVLRSSQISASIQSPYGKKTIRIDPGPIWLNMEALYSQRERSEFERELVEQARLLLSNRTK